MITEKDIEVVQRIHKTVFGDAYPEESPMFLIDGTQDVFVYFSPYDVEILNSYMIDVSFGFDIVKGKIKKSGAQRFSEIEDDFKYLQDGVFYVRIFKNSNGYEAVLRELKFFNVMNNRDFNYKALLDRINKIVREIKDVLNINIDRDKRK